MMSIVTFFLVLKEMPNIYITVYIYRERDFLTFKRGTSGLEHQLWDLGVRSSALPLPTK